MLSTVLFDLDGTLIDSSTSILGAFANALAREEISPVAPIDQALIGPPLRISLSRIAGTEDPDLIERLASSFRAVYDTAGYLETAVYPGIDEALRTLSLSGCKMFIVTNKRIYPTRLILDMLRWSSLFSGVYALDAIAPAAPSKGALIRNVLARHSVFRDDACLVGDTPEDAFAAQENDLQFYGATWGYGRFPPSDFPAVSLLHTPSDIGHLRLNQTYPND
jgi:phosphoglycolate phosphatase